MTAEAKYNKRIAEAAKQLIAAMDYVLGPEWRATTLGVSRDLGDELNWAWDELVSAIEVEPATAPPASGPVPDPASAFDRDAALLQILCEMQAAVNQSRLRTSSSSYHGR